jgi:drug/metabolite transporter (DMT)-like permease
MAPHAIIFLRCLFGAILLFLYAKIRNDRSMRWSRGARRTVLVGFLLGLHWWLYFVSLKLTSVSISMVIMFTAPIMSGFIEPFINKIKFERIQILLGLLMLVGIFIMNPNIDFSSDKSLGIISAFISAMILTLRNIYSKNLIGRNDVNSISLTGYQFAGAAMLFLPFGFTSFAELDLNNLWMLSILVLITTVLGQFIFLNSLKVFSATVAGLVMCIQPLIGSFYAWLLLGETVSINTIIGGAIILASAAIVNIRQLRS